MQKTPEELATEMQDELTTEMHAEFLEDEFTPYEMKMLGVRGALRRGLSLEDALKRYEVTEDEFRAFAKERGYRVKI